MWVTMYPAWRMLILVVVIAGLGYAIVALVYLMPASDGPTVYYVAPLVPVAVFVAIFAHGEPSDQAKVHWPRLSEAEFNALEDQVDQLDSLGRVDHAHPHVTHGKHRFNPARNQKDFMELVRQAIDDLPPEFAHTLDHVAVVVSDQGAMQRYNGRHRPLYGLYVGYGGRSSYVISRGTRSALPDRIVIFRDTLVHDYGNDPTRLRAAVAGTLRHELAHHLGFDETGVQALGL